MPRPQRPAVLLTLGVALIVAGCSSDASEPTEPSGSPTPSPVVTAAGPVPEVEGGFGEPPVVTVPDEAPADALVVETLVTGDGAVVEAGDLIAVHYLGQTWDDGTVFDQSFSRGTPAGFVIGERKVIAGWDSALVGQTVGSRVVMAVPPSLGYGDQGQPSAGIQGDDTLVFVVDILGAYPPGSPAAAGSTSAGADLKGLPQVEGETGERPSVTVPSGTEPPAKQRVVVLEEGEGRTIEAGDLLVVQYEAVTWDGQPSGSTWEAGQAIAIPAGIDDTPSPFDALVGTPVGSRVLLLVPATGDDDPDTMSVAVAIDVVDAIPSLETS